MPRALLFAYGTLLTTTGDNSLDEFIAHHTQALTDGYIHGHMYTLGHYPGVVPSANAKHKVYGKLLRLKGGRSTLRVLDRYEGIRGNDGRRSEYHRTQAAVYFPNVSVACWPGCIFLIDQRVACLL